MSLSNSKKRRLLFAIVDFLQREMAEESKESDSAGMSEDAKESLEVASQCIQTAYGLSSDDKHLAVTKTLEEIFDQATQNEPLRKKEAATAEEKARADQLKTEGNDLMRQEKYDEAVHKYSEAVSLDPSNQVFYCNRAAAFSKLGNHLAAVEDCKRALDMDPNYSKAYGRMGLAYSSLEKHREAVDCFKKALDMEPDNESYKSNLQLAQEKMSIPQPQMPPMFGAGGMDLGAMLSNPALMNMATSMLSDPNVQNMMGSLMSGGLAGGPGGENNPNSVDNLIQAGQRLAQQLQEANPELVNQLRQQMGQDNDGSNNPDSNPGNPPEGNSS